MVDPDKSPSPEPVRTRVIGSSVIHLIQRPQDTARFEQFGSEFEGTLFPVQTFCGRMLKPPAVMNMRGGRTCGPCTRNAS